MNGLLDSCTGPNYISQSFSPGVSCVSVSQNACHGSACVPVKSCNEKLEVAASGSKGREGERQYRVACRQQGFVQEARDPHEIKKLCLVASVRRKEFQSCGAAATRSLRLPGSLQGIAPPEAINVRPKAPPPGRLVTSKSEFHSTWARFAAKRAGGFIISGQTPVGLGLRMFQPRLSRGLQKLRGFWEL